MPIQCMSIADKPKNRCETRPTCLSHRHPVDRNNKTKSRAFATYL